MPNESTPFDFDSVEIAVDGESPEEGEALYTREDLAQALAGMLVWIVSGSPYVTQRRGKLRTPRVSSDGKPLLPRMGTPLLGKRALAAAWVVAPHLFNGCSLAHLASLPATGATRKTLSKHAQDFERMYGLKSRALRAEVEREHSASSARKRWQERQRIEVELESRAPRKVGRN